MGIMRLACARNSTPPRSPHNVMWQWIACSCGITVVHDAVTNGKELFVWQGLGEEISKVVMRLHEWDY